MISNHFPMTYGHPYGWLVLVVLMAIGAWVRHFFNLRHQGRVVWAIPASAALGVIVLAIAIAPRNVATPQASVTFSQAQAVITPALHALPLGAADPARVPPQAPNGVMFDTPDQIVSRAQQIYQQAVVTKNMPFGNLTNITQDERDLLAAWVQRARQRSKASSLRQQHVYQGVANRLLPAVGVPAAAMHQQSVPLGAAERPDEIGGFGGAQPGPQEAGSGQRRTDGRLGFEPGAVEALCLGDEQRVAGFVQEEQDVAETLVGEPRDRADRVQGHPEILEPGRPGG